jgi:hypothetical protein
LEKETSENDPVKLVNMVVFLQRIHEKDTYLRQQVTVVRTMVMAFFRLADDSCRRFFSLHVQRFLP